MTTLTPAVSCSGCVVTVLCLWCCVVVPPPPSGMPATTTLTTTVRSRIWSTACETPSTSYPMAGSNASTKSSENDSSSQVAEECILMSDSRSSSLWGNSTYVATLFYLANQIKLY